MLNKNAQIPVIEYPLSRGVTEQMASGELPFISFGTGRVGWGGGGVWMVKAKLKSARPAERLHFTQQILCTTRRHPRKLTF